MNYGDGGTGEEALESNNMREQARYAKALDDLSNLPKWFEPGTKENNPEKKVKIKLSKLDEYYNQALTFYVGPREQGHSIWIDLQTNLKDLLKTALLGGYAVNQREIQELIVTAATAKTLMESNGLGSAGRSGMRR